MAVTQARAQAPTPRVVVTGGEHAGFTRIVLQSTRPLSWSLTGEGRRYTLTLAPAQVDLDLSRAFDRIARTRLAAIEPGDSGVILHLNCACIIHGFDDRPGVIVLDIRDAPLPGAPAPAEATAGDPAQAGPQGTADLAPAQEAERQAGRGETVAHLAGQALAERLRRQALAAEGQSAASPAPRQDMPTRPGAFTATPGPGPLFLGGPEPAGATPAEEPSLRQDVGGMALRLATRMAEAVEQGLLTGIPPHQAPDRLLPGVTLEDASDQTGQMRISSDLAPPPADDPSPSLAQCARAASLGFLADPAVTDFAARHGALMRRLHGEFDRPDETATRALVQLYLSHGFGAEARQVIDSARTALTGHDLLLGLADLLEDRQSNSRLQLSTLQGCPGPAGLVAALAASDGAGFAVNADDLVIAYGTLPPALQRLFGQPLIAALVAAGAIDQARMVLGMLQNAGPAGVADPVVPAALLSAARGAPVEAARRLAVQSDSDDAAALLLRLQLALQSDSAAQPTLLAEGEDLAGMLRRQAEGIALMAAVIRLHAAGAGIEAGFAALDRLRGWLGPYAEDRALDLDLTELLWRRAGETADDQPFLALFMSRDDRSPDRLAGATRQVLADRLLRLGLPRPAMTLLTPPEDPAQALLLAEAMLMVGDAAAALALLGDSPATDPEPLPAAGERRAQQLMAQALRALGATEAAIATLAAGGAMAEASRLALIAGDWQTVDGLLSGRAPAHPAAPGIEADTLRPPPPTVVGTSDLGVDPGLTPALSADAPPLARADPEGPAGLAAVAGVPRETAPVGDRPASEPGTGGMDGMAGAADPAETEAMLALARALGSPPGALSGAPLPPVTAAADADPTQRGPERPEAAQMRRNAILLDQSETLRALVEGLLTDGN